MQLISAVSGHTFVDLSGYNEALHRLRELSIFANNMRQSLLRDIQILEDQNKNSLAKSIRLLIKFEKMVASAEGIRL